MSKKILYTVIIIFILLVLVTGTIIYILQSDEDKAINNNVTLNDIQNEDETLDLPTEGNDMVITTKSSTTIRVINEYDKNLFTANKNLLIMFGSWCPNCQEEIHEIQEILKRYKNNNDVNIVVIAHEFKETVSDLISLVENDVDFGDTEVKLDLGRVIRKKLDPEASSVPISYVVDKNENVLEVLNESLTLEKAIEMLEK